MLNVVLFREAIVDDVPPTIVSPPCSMPEGGTVVGNLAPIRCLGASTLSYHGGNTPLGKWLVAGRTYTHARTEKKGKGS